MGELFRGKSTKFSLLALAIALVFLTGWIRSHLFLDKVEIIGRACMVSIASVQHCLHIEKRGIFFELPKRYTLPRLNLLSLRLPKARVATVNEEHHVRGNDHMDKVKWQFDFMGFHLSSGNSITTDVDRVVIPYWSVVIPLTLLSGCLFIPNRRKSNSMKTVDLIANDGAT